MQNPFALALAGLGLLATVGFTTAIDTRHLGHGQTLGMMAPRHTCITTSHTACRHVKRV
jgi:hypothetical protein